MCRLILHFFSTVGSESFDSVFPIARPGLDGSRLHGLDLLFRRFGHNEIDGRVDQCVQCPLVRISIEVSPIHEAHHSICEPAIHRNGTWTYHMQSGELRKCKIICANTANLFSYRISRDYSLCKRWFPSTWSFDASDKFMACDSAKL